MRTEFLRNSASFILSVFGLSSPALGGAYETYFGTAKDGLACYAQTYDEAFLDANPLHNVKSIALDVAAAKVNGESNEPQDFEMALALKLKTSAEWYGQAGVCKAEGDGFSCLLQADGGLFTLTPDGADKLLLETGQTGIFIEGRSDVVTLDGKAGGVKVFSLVKSKAECEEANAYFSRDQK